MAKKRIQKQILRPKEEIDKDFSGCATLIGDKKFKMKQLEAETNLLLIRMTELALEYAEQEQVSKVDQNRL